MDATAETLLHIRRVQALLGQCVRDLTHRQDAHDASKLESPEIEAFAEYTPKLKGSTYGGEEYRGFLAAMKPALEHHYARNRHHPEHFAGGVRDMTLLDVLEMLCDWKAAGERHADGSIWRSIELNQQRFGYGDELKSILLATARYLWHPVVSAAPHRPPSDLPPPAPPVVR